MLLGFKSPMLDMCFSLECLGNIGDWAMAIIEFWCSFTFLMLEDKHGLGVGGIDRLQFIHLFYY